jgi:hypothetical protein
MEKYVQEILFNIEVYSPSQLDRKLTELELINLARYLKNKFPTESRSIAELVDIIKDEYRIQNS